MDWRPDPERDGLSLEQPPSTLEGVRFRDALRRFVASRRGAHTTSMARHLRDGVDRRFLTRDVLEQFSKWCTTWEDDPNFAGSATPAGQVSEVLFGEVVPRMRDNHDEPVEHADELWAAFCRRLARG